MKILRTIILQGGNEYLDLGNMMDDNCFLIIYFSCECKMEAKIRIIMDNHKEIH